MNKRSNNLRTTTGSTVLFFVVGLLLIAGAVFLKWKASRNELDMSGFELFIFLTLFWLFGIILTFFGFFSVWDCVERKKQEILLRRNGVKVEAKIVDTLEEHSFSENGVYPVYLICRAYNPNTMLEETYQSVSVFGNVSRHMGKKIVVYVNPKDSSAYFVDLNSLK